MAARVTLEPNDEELRARQRSRSIAMGIALALFVILMFAITIAKMTVNQ